MFPQLCKLIVQLKDASLRNTYVLTVVVGLYCAFPGEVGLGIASHEIVALHCESLAWTSLAIGENGSMITLKSF
jgi:hypothetical protein